MPRTVPWPAPLRLARLRRAHAPVRRALLAVLRRTRTRRVDRDDTTIRFVLMHAWGVGGTIRTVLTLAGHLAEHHDVEVISVVRRRDDPHFPFPPGVTVSALDDQRPSVRRGPLARLGHAVLSGVPGVLMDRRDLAARAMSLWTDLRMVRRLHALRGGALVGTRPGLNLLVLDLAGDGVVTIGQEHMHLARHSPSKQATIARRYPSFDAVVTLTEADRREYEARLAAPTLVRRIPNVVPDLGGAQADPAARTVIAAGRLTPQKGFDLLIDAWVPVAAAHPDWTLRICGGGRQQRALERRVRRRRLEGSVVLAGPVPDLGAEMARASVFVLSSRFEGLPMALLEAMGAGMAIASFDCPTGPRELLEDGRDGLLVPPEDRAALSIALQSLLGDEDARRRLGAAVRERSAAFAPPVVLERWETLFEELGLGPQRRGTPNVASSAPRVRREPVLGSATGRAAPRWPGAAAPAASAPPRRRPPRA